MSQSKFYSSLFLVILLNAVIKPLWIFGIDRQVQNIIGVEEYGVYFSLLNLSIVFGFLLDFGMTNFVNRELAAGQSGLQGQIGGLLMLKFLFFIGYSAIVIAVAKISGVQRWDILAGVIVIQFLAFLLLFIRNIITANQWFKTDAWLSVLDKTLMIIVCGVLIFQPAFLGTINIQRFLTAQVVTSATAIFIALIILLKRGIKIKKPSLKFFDRKLALAALPFAITIFLMSLHVRLDGFLLERLHVNGAHEAGLYAAAYRLLDASNMICFLVAAFFMPFAAKLWSEGGDLRPTILQTRHLQIMFAVTIAAITILLAPWLQNILYHRSDDYGVKILQWCLPALIGYAFVQVYGTVMTATGEIVAFCYLNLGAVLLNVTLNLLLIPRLGAFGCCLSALFSQGMLGMATMLFVHKKLKMPVGAGSMIVYLLNGMVICAILYMLLKTTVNTWLLLPAAACTAFLFMWFSRMISLDRWLNFLKKQ